MNTNSAREGSIAKDFKITLYPEGLGLALCAAPCRDEKEKLWHRERKRMEIFSWDESSSFNNTTAMHAMETDSSMRLALCFTFIVSVQKY